MVRLRNPLAFTPLPVSIFTSAIYIAIFAVLLVVHHQVPPAPASATPGQWPGVNLTQAWHDLQTLCSDHHPYNSAANLKVRAWLEGRIGQILDNNHVHWATEVSTPGSLHTTTPVDKADAVLFDDRSSNITFPDARPYVNYFEGDNLMVYIRGTDDPAGAFWSKRDSPVARLVLVNSHYDSVSTGYGATDDGAGVITCLQLISHFTNPDVARPKHGLLILINDAEEDGLYGAAAYMQHPMARHTTAFLNLEGAGAGGRATLFRSTDIDVTATYGKSEHPFGTVTSADAFKFDLVRSDTDYSVFYGVLGMRGLDVAFMGPRSAYHTPRDDVRDTSKASVWHMMSASLATTTGLTKKEWDKGEENEISGVWFDIFGLGFAVLRLHTLFALNITLLVVGPVLLILLEVLLKKQGKWYPFSLKTFVHGEDDDEPVQLYGMKGFFRFPLAFIVSTAIVVALAYLVTKINPLIVYSSPYAVWAMSLSAFAAFFWFFLRLSDSVRPSALTRFYSLLWIYTLSWIFLVGATVAADRFGLGGGYFFTIYNASVFLALLVSYLDLFALPSKDKYADHVTFGHDNRSVRRQSRPTSSHANDETEANERTALLSPTNGANRNDRQTFARYNQRRPSQDPAADDDESVVNLFGAEPYEHEQLWSARLPRWTWVLQVIFLLPINLILIGQGGLLLTTALSQTPADGNPVLTIYLAIGILSVLLLVPTAPVLHRVVWQIPTLLFLVLIGTTIYNLVAFPFSRDARLKVFFVQRMSLDSGENEVALVGLPGWVQRVAHALPSTAGQELQCGHGIRDWARRNELETCVWRGAEPDVMRGYNASNPIKREEWLSVSSTPLNSTSLSLSRSSSFSSSGDGKKGELRRVQITLRGRNTRACRLYFARPVADFTVLNACPDLSFSSSSSSSSSLPSIPGTTKHYSNSTTDPYACTAGQQISYPGVHTTPAHSSQLRLWSRSFDEEFRVVVDVNGTETLAAKAVCLWSDANERGTVPAWDEVELFAPSWVAGTKHADGLVEGWRDFEI
ncbi:hypothetical protein K461DRAFT_328443 [Myriangium duriaei CBS 260.36]|uniref:Peptide hydrolase n=1 Tax=Myriangium duriaei CBS 260.36 TaxID=1168546 RepID=A0A9P4MIF1_9PEZI|nr:hypothetical protein K461DRAFT_328443 [Myriangium duriaei CBS 260.36]